VGNDHHHIQKLRLFFIALLFCVCTHPTFAQIPFLSGPDHITLRVSTQGIKSLVKRILQGAAKPGTQSNLLEFDSPAFHVTHDIKLTNEKGKQDAEEILFLFHMSVGNSIPLSVEVDPFLVSVDYDIVDLEFKNSTNKNEFSVHFKVAIKDLSIKMPRIYAMAEIQSLNKDEQPWIELINTTLELDPSSPDIILEGKATGFLQGNSSQIKIEHFTSNLNEKTNAPSLLVDIERFDFPSPFIIINGKKIEEKRELVTDLLNKRKKELGNYILKTVGILINEKAKFILQDYFEKNKLSLALTEEKAKLGIKKIEIVNPEFAKKEQTGSDLFSGIPGEKVKSILTDVLDQLKYKLWLNRLKIVNKKKIEAGFKASIEAHGEKVEVSKKIRHGKLEAKAENPDFLYNEDYDLAISVSESLLNALIVSADKTGLIDQIKTELKADNIDLGKDLLKIHVDPKKGSTINLIANMNLDLSKINGIASFWENLWNKKTKGILAFPIEFDIEALLNPNTQELSLEMGSQIDYKQFSKCFKKKVPLSLVGMCSRYNHYSYTSNLHYSTGLVRWFLFKVIYDKLFKKLQENFTFPIDGLNCITGLKLNPLKLETEKTGNIVVYTKILGLTKKSTCAAASTQGGRP